MRPARQRFDGILIAHLGNTDGRNPERENTLKYLQETLAEGFHVCLRVQYFNDAFLLPTAGGFNNVPPAFLSKQRVWCCTDNAETLDALCAINAHAFFVSENMPTLTTAQFIWTLPPHNLSQRSIAAFPELAAPEWLSQFEPAGICSNEPRRYI